MLLSELPVRLHQKLIEELVVSVVVPNRHHDDPTRFQLVDESLRHSGRDCTSMDDIVRSSILLSLSSIATINFDAAILKLLAVALRQVVNAELCQLLDVLDSDDVRRAMRSAEDDLLRRGFVRLATKPLRASAPQPAAAPARDCVRIKH